MRKRQPKGPPLKAVCVSVEVIPAAPLALLSPDWSLPMPSSLLRLDILDALIVRGVVEGLFLGGAVDFRIQVDIGVQRVQP